jgi:hypothetical protein
VEGNILTIPGDFTKNRRAHSIPLLPLARTILDELPDQGDFYFPGRTENTHFNDGSWGKLKIEIGTRAGVTKWQLRDIRRTFRSNLSKLRVPREVSEILLNHVTGANKNDLDEIYDRYDYLLEKRECGYRKELDLETLVCTRGRAFPLARVAERLRCPRCGCRRVAVMFGPPNVPQANANAALMHRDWLYREEG